MGKGFRINCATCFGEYISIFFCWIDDGSLPKSFEKVDPETGIIRTSHNIPVELSKVTSGDKIVENIVEQVRPTLNHFTDLMVDDPPTVLLAMEKRIGDVIFDNELRLGSVETGMEANFTYSMERKMVADLPQGDLKELETVTVNIYVGSDTVTPEYAGPGKSSTSGCASASSVGIAQKLDRTPPSSLGRDALFWRDRI